MSPTASQDCYSTDLAGIVVGTTAISDVRGDEGMLTYRGISIDRLVERPFARVAWLLVFGGWPSAAQEKALDRFLANHRQLPDAELQMLKTLHPTLHPMLMLQSLVPTVAPPEPGDDRALSGDAAHGLAIAARIPAWIAAWQRLRTGAPVVAADADLSHHADFLRMFRGEPAGGQEIRTLDAVQILQMEHSFNASTFAGRVCASTEAPVQSVLAASIGTLFGRLHGGADQAALAMAREIGSPDAAATYVDRCLADGVKIMGMGHREYRTVDPRARILKPMADSLCKTGESRRLFDTLCAVEAACKKAFIERGRQIWANVEFYKGAVFHSLGIPDDCFTAMFAMARVYGYLAHYLEFRPSARLIRPRARYVSSDRQADSG